MRRAGERLVVEQARHVGPPREVLHRAAERGVERVALMLVDREVLEHVDERPEPALEHRGVERLLAGEVVVEARRREADRGRDVAHRGAGEAALREQRLRGVENAVAGDGRLSHSAGPRDERTFVYRAKGSGCQRIFEKKIGCERGPGYARGGGPISIRPSRASSANAATSSGSNWLPEQRSTSASASSSPSGVR